MTARRTRSAAVSDLQQSLVADPLGMFAPPPEKVQRDFFANMNPEQVEVIAHDDGPIKVDAGAGSGKTRALVHRIARLVHDKGVDPSRIMAVTFSKKAADEMNKRLRDLGVTTDAVGTWHAWCLRVLKEDRTEWAGWQVDESDRARFVLKDVLGYKYMDWKDADLGKVRRFIGWCKAHLWTPDHVEAMDFARTEFGPFNGRRAIEAFNTYNIMLNERGLLTFDDFLVFCHKHFASDDYNRARWAAKYDYCLQDEVQDENWAQKTLMAMLVAEHMNIMVVGDVAQSIYGFRGSKPDYLAQFEQEFAGAKIVNMRRNYRSGDRIVDVANKIIQPGEFRGPDMIAERGVEGQVLCTRYVDFDEEARAFADWCVANVIENGGTWADSTALFRTNAQSRALEEALLSKKIPYIVVGGASFYERREVKDLLAYLRIAADMDREGDSVKRCINAPFRYLGAKFVEKVTDRAVASRPQNAAQWTNVIMEVAESERIQQRQKSSAREWCDIIAHLHREMYPEQYDIRGEDGLSTKKPAKPSDMLNDVIHRTRYLDWLQKEEGEESIESSHAANVRELVRVAERFATVQELITYIEEQIASSKKQRKDGQAGGNTVLLMSIHRSKGLEWPRVWVVGCNEGILPHRMGDPEEERRLAYVAATRARDALMLSYVQNAATRAGVKKLDPAGFLSDAGLVEVDANVY